MNNVNLKSISYRCNISLIYVIEKEKEMACINYKINFWTEFSDWKGQKKVDNKRKRLSHEQIMKFPNT